MWVGSLSQASFTWVPLWFSWARMRPIIFPLRSGQFAFQTLVSRLRTTLECPLGSCSCFTENASKPIEPLLPTLSFKSKVSRILCSHSEALTHTTEWSFPDSCSSLPVWFLPRTNPGQRSCSEQQSYWHTAQLSSWVLPAPTSQDSNSKSLAFTGLLTGRLKDSSRIAKSSFSPGCSQNDFICYRQALCRLARYQRLRNLGALTHLGKALICG